MTRHIYHLTASGAWNKQKASGEYRHESLEFEGFIHTSTAKEIVATANRFFRGQQDLVLLAINRDRVQAKILDEEVYPGRIFPHIYGPLNVDAVEETCQVSCGPDGMFTPGSFQPVIKPTESL